jgi:PIN domain nuclease of toxin-antitoxin system
MVSRKWAGEDYFFHQLNLPTLSLCTGPTATPPLLDAHKDTADRFIVATAIHHRAILVTADAHTLSWQGALSSQNARL